MEMDREDGTEFVLAFTVDVNENRAEGCKTHTFQPHGAHTHRVFHKGPNQTGTLGGTRVSSEEINGFLEPGPEPEDEKSTPGTSGHIWTTDGEPGYFVELDQNRKPDGADVRSELRTNSESENEEAVDLRRFCSDPIQNEGTEGVRETDSSVITPETGGTHPGCCKSGDDPQEADDWEVRGNRSTSAAPGCSRRREVTRDAASAGEPNGNLTAPGTVNTSDGEDADVWEFNGCPVVIGETSKELTETRWPEETSRPSETNTSPKLADKMVDIEGTWASLATSGGTSSSRRTNSNQVIREEPPGTYETKPSPFEAEKMVAVGGTSASLTSREPEGTRSTDVAVELSGNYADQSTSGETAGSRRTNPGPVVAGVCGRRGNVSVLDVKTAASVTGDLLSVKETSVSRMVAGAMDTPAQVAGIRLLGNEAQWENPDGPVRPHVRGGKCVRSCCSEVEMKIPNGHVDFGEGEAVRVGNRGFLVINRRSLSGTSSIPVYSMREPRKAGEPPQEVRSCSDPGPETVSKRSAANVNEDVSEQKIAGPDRDVVFSSGFGVERPRTLRTNPGQVMSLSCDSTPLNLDNAGYFVDDGDLEIIMNSLELSRRRSAPDELHEREQAGPEPSAQRGDTPSRRHGFTEFLTRSLLSWKPKESKVTAASPGWRIFGKGSPKGADSVESGTPQQQPEAVRRKNLDFEPLSTTGLILEDRPASLPAKSEEEAQRHRQQYNDMISGAKRRELKEAQRKKKQMKERHRQEESIARAVVVWNTEILPNWENTRNTRRVRELWWQGLPPSIRGKIWSLAIGNELNITPELYEIFLSRAKEKWRSFSETGSLSESEDGGVDRESSLDLIKLDIFRTFPSLYIFQKGGPYHDVLHNVLGAYTCYRPDVGYVQGMSFIAAVLILNLEEADAFIAFANLLNKPCQMAFFRVDHDLMLKYFAAFEVFFEENLPKLFQHFLSNRLTPDFYLIDWIFTLYSKPLPLDVACRVWDLFCRDGEEALFRTALGILRLYQDVLMQMDFIQSAQFLSRLLQNTPAHTLFTCIANTHMLSNNRRWNQVFSALMKDGPKEADKTGSPALRS